MTSDLESVFNSLPDHQRDFVTTIINASQKMVRRFGFYFYFVSWTDISLGINICLKNPYIEIHIPFGFIHFGFSPEPLVTIYRNEECARRTFGYEYKSKIGIEEFAKKYIQENQPPL